MIRWTILSLLLAWTAQAAPVKIVVNGREVETSVIETNGVIYVPVDTLAKALDISIAIRSNEVATVEARPTAPAVVESPAPPATKPPPPPRATRTVVLSSPRPPRIAPAIKGTVRFRLTITDSRGRDEGAQIWLVPAAEVSSLAAAAGGTMDEPIPTGATGWEAKLTEQFKFPHTVANTLGEYSFFNVAPGRYLLVLRSKHTNSIAARDRGGKMRFKKIVVTETETADGSFTFGMSALPLKESR